MGLKPFLRSWFGGLWDGPPDMRTEDEEKTDRLPGLAAKLRWQLSADLPDPRAREAHIRHLIGEADYDRYVAPQGR